MARRDFYRYSRRCISDQCYFPIHAYPLYYLKMNYLLNSIILNNKFYFEFSFITSTILIKNQKNRN